MPQISKVVVRGGHTPAQNLAVALQQSVLPIQSLCLSGCKPDNRDQFVCPRGATCAVPNPDFGCIHFRPFGVHNACSQIALASLQMCCCGYITIFDAKVLQSGHDSQQTRATVSIIMRPNITHMAEASKVMLATGEMLE